MNNTTFETRLFDYLFPCTGLEVESQFIEIHQDFTRLQKPYASWQVLGTPQQGESITFPIDADGFQTISTAESVNVQVNFYGDNSLSLAKDFIIRLQMEASLYRGESLNFDYSTISQAIDTSTIVGDTYERRYSVQIALNATSALVQNVGIIEQAVIEGRIADAETTVTVGVITNEEG
jgi:hypothetical protein